MEKRKAQIIGLSVAGLVIFGPGFACLIRQAWQQHQLDHKRQRLQATHDALVREHERLASDPGYVEGLIRSTFKVAKPGELVVPLESRESTRHAR